MGLRQEFCVLALQDGANVSELCRRFGVSRKTGYKWLGRYRDAGAEGLADRSRRPGRVRSPTPVAMEQAVLSVREQHPCWGGRKIRRRLLDTGHAASPAAASTITRILHRHGRIDPSASAQAGAWQRFERPSPNDLWQMDFKGEFRLADQRWCFPLTILDDHSRYNLCLQACPHQKGATVKQRLTAVFERYGLPRMMLMDNGPPWGATHGPYWTQLKLWLLRLGVKVTHGRPHHPQTQGKEERFHRTLKLELLQGRAFADLADAQARFDPWRAMYNHDRPHEALGLAVPASRYRASDRSMPPVLPAIQYSVLHTVRRVNAVGYFSFQNVRWWLGEAFGQLPVGLRPTTRDGLWDVYFCSERLGILDVAAARQRGAKRDAVQPASARCARSVELHGESV